MAWATFRRRDCFSHQLLFLNTVLFCVSELFAKLEQLYRDDGDTPYGKGNADRRVREACDPLPIGSKSACATFRACLRHLRRVILFIDIEGSPATIRSQTLIRLVGSLCECHARA